MAQQPLVVQGLLIIEASRSHSDTPYMVDYPRRVISLTQRLPTFRMYVLPPNLA